jgi:hypothetical protein
MTKSPRLFFAMAMLLAVSVQSSAASPMQLVMTGQTDHLVSNFNPANEPFTITLSYDTNNIASTSVDAVTQIYSLGKASSLTVSVAGTTVYSLYQNVEVEIYNALPPVPGATHLIGVSMENSFQPGSLGLVSGPIGPINTLPFSLLQSSFQGGDFQVDDPTSAVVYSGVISGANVGPGEPVIVPEPGHAVLLCLVSGGVILQRLRKQVG